MDIRILNKTAISNLDTTAQILYDNGTTNLSGGYPHPLSCGIFMPTTFVVPTRIKPHTSMTGRESQIQHHSCGNKLRRPDTVVEARRPMPTKHCVTSTPTKYLEKAMNHSSACTPAVQIFNFQSNHAVRVAFDDNGEPLFCLTDVATILEISNANPSRFNLDRTGVHKMYISYPSGAKQVTFINEPNLYRVIFRSNKPEAVKFQNWVFDEVLPTLRKTGSYTIAKPSVPAPKPQSPKLSQSDYATVRRAVYFLSKNMYHTGTATNVIYARLRSLCEVEHMADIRYDQLTIVQNELYRIERILRAYTNYRQQTEKTLMSRICMGDSEVVGQAMIAMETTATAYAQVFDEATSAVAYANKVAGEGK